MRIPPLHLNQQPEYILLRICSFEPLPIHLPVIVRESGYCLSAEPEGGRSPDRRINRQSRRERPIGLLRQTI